MNQPHEDYQADSVASGTIATPFALSHIVHVLRHYRAVILLSIIGVAVGYSIVAVIIVLASPSQRVTSIPFRLDFEGASQGQYPNGLRFSPAEIVSSPVLLRVFQKNHLDQFTHDFGKFSRSVFVLESNAAYETLAAEYQARLSDQKLGPVDRDRIEKEFALKRDSIDKNEYSVNYIHNGETPVLPETLLRKVLKDVVSEWAQYAVDEQHALDYRISILSPQIVDDTTADPGDFIAQVLVLRMKVFQVLFNISELNKAPGAELARTASDRMSLREIALRLGQIVRFRLEPLVGAARSSGLMTNPALTTRFLENQLAYDQRQLEAARREANAIRDALLVYADERTALPDTSTASAASGNTKRSNTMAGSGETVMPQFSETFLDRLMVISSQSADAKFRQKLVDDYRMATIQAIPLEEDVAYDTQILNEVKSPAASQARVEAPMMQAEIKSSTAEVRLLISKMNEIYRIISRNTNASMQLFTLTGTPTTRVERTASLSRLALYGVLVLLLALPMIVLVCLIHNRLREEESDEEYAEGLRPEATA